MIRSLPGFALIVIRELGLINEFALNDQPPISPEDAVTSPLSFTLNGALPLAARVVEPAKNLVGPVEDIPVQVLDIVYL